MADWGVNRSIVQVKLIKYWLFSITWSRSNPISSCPEMSSPSTHLEFQNWVTVSGEFWSRSNWLEFCLRNGGASKIERHDETKRSDASHCVKISIETLYIFGIVAASKRPELEAARIKSRPKLEAVALLFSFTQMAGDHQTISPSPQPTCTPCHGRNPSALDQSPWSSFLLLLLSAGNSSGPCRARCTPSCWPLAPDASRRRRCKSAATARSATSHVNTREWSWC